PAPLRPPHPSPRLFPYTTLFRSWLHGDTGKVKPFGNDDDGGDLVEAAFLMQGLIAVREYYKDGNEQEKGIAEKIDQLWKEMEWEDRKSTRLNSSHVKISYAVFCL